MFRTIVRRSSNGKILWTNEISVSIPYRAVDGRKIVENEIQSVLFIDRRSKRVEIPLLFLSYKSSKTPKFSWGFAPNPANALCVAFGDAPSALGASPQTPQKYSKKHWIFSIFVKNRYPTIGIFLSRGIGRDPDRCSGIRLEPGNRSRGRCVHCGQDIRMLLFAGK